MTTAKLNRRQLLQGMGLAATGAALAACVPAGAPADMADGGEMEPPDIWVAPAVATRNAPQPCATTSSS